MSTIYKWWLKHLFLVFFNRRLALSCHWKVRIFIAAELFIRAYAYTDHPKLQDTLDSKKTFTDHSDTLFSLLLSDEGCEEFDIRRNREDAIICESMKTYEDKIWSSMLHYWFVQCLNGCIKSVYLIANEGFRPLFHQLIYPLETISNIDREAKFYLVPRWKSFLQQPQLSSFFKEGTQNKD